MTRNPQSDGRIVISSLWGSMMNAHGAEAILDGVDPSVGTGNWDVDTTSGNVFINNTVSSVGADTTTLTDPASDADLDSGEFRVDLLTVDATGTINVSEGPAAAQPIGPDIPTDEAVICAVVVSGDASSLQSGDIRDYRTLIEDDSARYVDGGPHEIDAADLAGGGGTADQLLQTDGSAASWVGAETAIAAGVATESDTVSVTTGTGRVTVSLSNNYRLLLAEAVAGVDKSSSSGFGSYEAGVESIDIANDEFTIFFSVEVDADINWHALGVLA